MEEEVEAVVVGGMKERWWFDMFGTLMYNRMNIGVAEAT